MACYTTTSRVSKKQKFVDGIINTFGLEVDFEDEDDDEDDSKRSDSRRDNPHHHTDTNKQFIKAILVMKRVRDDGVPGERSPAPRPGKLTGYWNQNPKMRRSSCPTSRQTRSGFSLSSPGCRWN